jgi:hypothetical protein
VNPAIPLPIILASEHRQHANMMNALIGLGLIATPTATATGRRSHPRRHRGCLAGFAGRF